MYGSVVTRMLAASLLAGPLEEDALTVRWAEMLGRRWRWLRPLAKRACARFAGTSPRHDAVVRFIRRDAGWQRAQSKHDDDLFISSWHMTQQMRPSRAPLLWSPPSLRTTGDLARWLGLSVSCVDWLADLTGRAARLSGRSDHYRYRWLTKRSGHARLIESPKQRLKSIQRELLGQVIECLPPHAAAHGFRRGASIQTFAEPHVGRRLVLRMDLDNFFPRIQQCRVSAIFRAIGYTDSVADRLAALCCHRTPPSAWRDDSAPKQADIRRLYEVAHLPQGAPTSPALANLTAFRLDCRLLGLATAAGAQYTRYADDLVFSGDEDFARSAGTFRLHVAAIAGEEGFQVRHRKTRFMRRGGQQRIAGLVVNRRLNVARADYDLLKAILTNCARRGPDSQNRTGEANYRAHLLGRISFVAQIHPERGRRLRAIFDQIEWD